jgi:hypothetical protein
MQSFGEVRETPDSEPFDGRDSLAQEGDLLVQSQQGNQVVHALLERQLGIAEGLGGHKHLRHPSQEQKDFHDDYPFAAQHGWSSPEDPNGMARRKKEQ